LLLFLSNNSFAHRISSPIQNNLLQTPVSTNDTLLVLNIEMQYGARVLKVSFNGNEGTDGTLQIKLNNTVVKAASFELIKQPFYASVDISNLAAGTYQVVLTTAIGTHSSSILID
jgi:phenolic acid decarboxylase